MPGSHDSGMSMIGSCTAFANATVTQTQTHGILQQLQRGARYFDIRPAISNGKFVTGHYGWVNDAFKVQGCNGQFIDEIINDVNAFTSSYPELVILSVAADINTDVGEPYRNFNQSEWNELLDQLQLINYPYGSLENPDPNVDLSKLTLNDYIAPNGVNVPAVVVIVSPNDKTVTLGPYFGNGFYYGKNLPITGTYAGSDDLATMAKDQIAKMQALRTSPDDEMFQLSWTLTQQQGDVFPFVTPILKFADWANPFIGLELWPYITKQCFPNILITDDINSVSPDQMVNTCHTTALAIAINDFTALPTPYFYTTSLPERDHAIAQSGFNSEGIACFVLPDPAAGTVPLHRLAAGDEHFYTTSDVERDTLEKAGWHNEGEAGYVFPTQAQGTQPLHRLFNKSANEHFYTTSDAERDNAINDLGFVSEGEACYVYGEDPSGVTAFYRLKHSGAHFYTTSLPERDHAIAQSGFNSEGIACFVLPDPAAGTVPLHRLAAGDEHFYTTSDVERDTLEKAGWHDEGEAGYVFPTQAQGTQPLHRLFNKSANEHFYTTSDAERDNAIKNLGFTSEGEACYVFTADPSGVTPFYRMAALRP
jgi:hypothetical protein